VTKSLLTPSRYITGEDIVYVSAVVVAGKGTRVCTSSPTFIVYNKMREPLRSMSEQQLICTDI
jgi:hypothetical protein